MRQVLRSVVAVLAGFIVASVVMMAVEFANGHLFHPDLARAAEGVTDRESLRALLEQAPVTALLVVVAGWILGAVAGGWIAAAVTSPAPWWRRYSTTGSSSSLDTTRFFTFRMISVTSSATPSTVENSCITPSIRMLVTAAPGMEDSRVRRRELPRV